MDIKKLQKKVDQAIELLSDHDDKKDEQRYHNLRDKIEETQDYIDGVNHSNDISLELHKELVKCMKEFEEDRFIFIIFLIILCGLLFIGVFYITYSHMHGHFPHSPGGHLKPPHITKPQQSSTSTTSTTTSATTSITTSTNRPDSSTTITTQGTTSPSEDDDLTNAFVYLTFDNSNLIDLTNLYPVLDSNGLKSKPTTWSLMSKLENSSKDYILTYFIDFIDDYGNNGDENFIPVDKRLDVNKLKYQLLIKRSGSIVHDTGVQYLDDYPESTVGVRPIISGQTMNNDESLDFELRMWLDSTTGNDQQGKSYRFKIDVYYEFEFID